MMGQPIRSLMATNPDRRVRASYETARNTEETSARRYVWYGLEIEMERSAVR